MYILSLCECIWISRCTHVETRRRLWVNTYTTPTYSSEVRSALKLGLTFSWLGWKLASSGASFLGSS